MTKYYSILVLFAFLLGLTLYAVPAYAQDNWDDWGSSWDDDDDDETDPEEEEAFRLAANGEIKECEDYLRDYPDGPHAEIVKEMLKNRKAAAGKSASEIENENDDDGFKDLEDIETPTDPKDITDPKEIDEPAKPLTTEEIDFMRAGGSFWSTTDFSHVHLGLSFSFVDWEGTITAGTGSHTDVNAGVEYSLEEHISMPISAIAELGFRLANKNPWDSDTGFFAGWIGGKYLIMGPEAPKEDEGFALAASLLVGFGTGKDEENDHEQNLAIWLGHHQPVLFQLTPIAAVSASYKLNKTMAINGEAMFLFYLGIDDETDEPMDQLGISVSAEYFIAVSIVGLHAGFTFKTGYEPMLSMYINATSIFGAYVQFVVPFTSELEAVTFALSFGYDLKF